MQLRSKSNDGVQSETDQATVINTKLTKWWNEVDEYLESHTAPSSAMSRFHQMTLVVLRHESVIALNRSILATAKKASSYNEALQNCITAARAVINTLYKTLNDGGFDEKPSEVTPLLWPSFTWAVWMSAFILIHAEHEGQVPQAVAIRYVFSSPHNCPFDEIPYTLQPS